MFDRFMERVKKTDSCWIWNGYRCHGYGEFYLGIKKPVSIKAHRASYLLFVGDIKRKVVMHKCDNPSCVNPAHLKTGYAKDNVLDCVNKGRHNNQNSIKKYCKNGHRLSGINVKIESTGFRRCQTCRKEYQRRYEREQRNKR